VSSIVRHDIEFADFEPLLLILLDGRQSCREVVAVHQIAGDVAFQQCVLGEQTVGVRLFVCERRELCLVSLAEIVVDMSGCSINRLDFHVLSALFLVCTSGSEMQFHNAHVAEIDYPTANWSLNAYPAPRTVRIGSFMRPLLIALRRRPTWTSTVRSST